MKRLIVMVFLLTGCAKANQALDAFGPPHGGTCKALTSTWLSDTDLEHHDFSTLVVDTAQSEYNYTSPTGETCGFPVNTGNHFLANIVTQASTDDPSFTHVIYFYGEDVVPASCHNWQQQAPPNDPHGWAYMKLECNKLTMCYQLAPPASGCKTFH